MMPYRFISLTRQGALGILIIDHPETLNALSRSLLCELRQAIGELATDTSLKVLIITGSGRSFVAGADITEMSAMSPVEAKSFGKLGADVFRAIELLPFPVIAAVNGFALGGGCELAMACDLRIATTTAKFGQPEVGLGIIPGFGGTQRMARLIGAARAKELIFTARVIKADEALAVGLVNRVVEVEELIGVAKSIAEKIISNSSVAVRLAKEAIDKGLQTDIDTGASLEQNLFALCFSSEEQKEGMEAFLQKRKPKFQV